MSVLQTFLPVAYHNFSVNTQIFNMALTQPTVSLNIIKYNEHSHALSLYDTVILMCLVLFIPAVVTAKWHENYSQDEIKTTHHSLNLCFIVTFFALAALPSKSYKLGPHLHRQSFPPAFRFFLYHCTGFLFSFLPPPPFFLSSHKTTDSLG